MAVKLKILDPTSTKRAAGYYRFDADGLSVETFPGEPDDYDPGKRQSSEARRRRDLRLWIWMRSAERRRRFAVVSADAPSDTAAPVESPAPGGTAFARPTPPTNPAPADEVAAAKVESQAAAERRQAENDGLVGVTGLPLPVPQARPEAKPARRTPRGR